MAKPDSRTEIVIVAGIGAVLLFFLLRRQQSGQNTLSLGLLPAVDNGGTNSGVPLSLTMPAGTPGATVPAIPASPDISIGGITYSLANPSACGCGGGGTGNTYGSANDLAASLLSQGYDMPFIDPNTGQGVY